VRNNGAASSWLGERAAAIAARYGDRNMIVMGYPSARVLSAIGKVAVRHGQLDYALRMMVRTLTGVSIDDALAATEGTMSRDLRQRVRQLALKKFGDGTVLIRIDALLQRASAATQRRNELLHGLWVNELDGEPMFRNKGAAFERSPRIKDLTSVADALAKIRDDFNEARLHGFIAQGLNAP
jgi:hypothetical protein